MIELEYSVICAYLILPRTAISTLSQNCLKYSCNSCPSYTQLGIQQQISIVAVDVLRRGLAMLPQLVSNSGA
jgi:hypothetical protein